MKALYPEVYRFLAQRPIRLFIGGQWVDAAAGRTIEVRNPGDGKPLAEVAAGEPPDIDRAVAAAQEIFSKSVWPRLPVNERAVYLHRAASHTSAGTT